jgi:NADPH-dependent 2,4-dienoyl-CoA reductase/sulfur reductase-like enzyme/nitrite reductase/ring-hydroxylating ferredoxin subunit
MSEEKWEQACSESELEEGRPRLVRLGKRNVLLALAGGEIHAVSGTCPHYGGPLHEGALLGDLLTCPWHTARFDVTTGTAVSPPAFDDLAQYAVKRENGAVYVKRIKRPAEEIEVRPDKGTCLVVGGGAAGFAAAVTLRKEGFDGRVIIATAEVELPYDRPSLSKEFLSGDMDPGWVPLKDEQFYVDMKIEIFSGHQVYAVDPARREVLFANSTTLHYDKLLLATGGVPRTPDIPGVHLPSFYLLRSFEDARALRSVLEEGRRAVIIGAGFIGLEAAAALRSRGLEVHLVTPEKLPMEKLLGERIAARLLNLHRDRGVRFHLEVFPEEIRGGADVEGVALSDDTVLPADLVIAGIGVVPAIHFLEGAGVVEGGAVPVDRMLRTKTAHIHAAGDIAAVPHPVTGKRRRVEHWVEAQRQGQHAARAMLGFSGEYREPPFFWTSQHGLILTSVGDSGGHTRIAYRGDPEGDSFLAGYYRGKRLEAAAGVGRAGEIILIGELLKRGISPGMKELERETFDLRELLPER